MKNKIKIGKTEDGEDVTLDIREDLISTGLDILGKRKSGKSYCANVILEGCLDNNYPVLVIDTTGEYSSLSEKYNVLVVSAGDRDYAHLKNVKEDDIPSITRYVVDNNLSLVLDLKTTLRKRYRVLSAFLKVIHDMIETGEWGGKNYILVQEEAHRIIPEKGTIRLKEISKYQKGVIFRSADLAATGRHEGLGYILISQRSAQVKNAVLSQCDTHLVFKTRKATDSTYLKNVGLGDRMEETENLDQGEAFIIKEEPVKFKVSQRKTTDLGQTPSQTIQERKPKKTPKLEKVISDLQEYVEKEEKKEEIDTEKYQEMKKELKEKKVELDSLKAERDNLKEEIISESELDEYKEEMAQLQEENRALKEDMERASEIEDKLEAGKEKMLELKEIILDLDGMFDLGVFPDTEEERPARRESFIGSDRYNRMIENMANRSRTSKEAINKVVGELNRGPATLIQLSVATGYAKSTLTNHIIPTLKNSDWLMKDGNKYRLKEEISKRN